MGATQCAAPHVSSCRVAICAVVRPLEGGGRASAIHSPQGRGFMKPYTLFAHSRAAKLSSAFAAALLVGTLPVSAHAATVATGDSRTVSQPALPAVCTPLSANLATSNEQFSNSAEASPPDTSRIQN